MYTLSQNESEHHSDLLMLGAITLSRLVYNRLTHASITRVVDAQRRRDCGCYVGRQPDNGFIGIHRLYCDEVRIETKSVDGYLTTHLCFASEAQTERHSYFPWKIGDAKNGNGSAIADADDKSIEMGAVSVTTVAMDIIPGIALMGFLHCHNRRDWGDCCEYDWLANERALKNGRRLVSVFHYNGETLFIITEAARSLTTVLMAYEY